MAVTPRATSVQIPYGTLVRQVEPDIEAQKRRELEYEFSNPKGPRKREFRTDRSRRWPYNQ